MTFTQPTVQTIHGRTLKVTPDPAARVVHVEQVCRYCSQPNGVIMPQQAFDDWVDGAFIQNAWPDAPSSLREAVISGIHPYCWDAMLGE